MSKKLKTLKYVIITLFNFFHASAMEAMPEENQSGMEIILETDQSDDCLSCILQKLPTSTAIFNFTSTCKRFHDLELKNSEYLYSGIIIQGLKIQIVKENKDIEIRLKQIKQALIFQENIYHLARSLEVDTNQKQRGQITITSKLSPDEIYGILYKLPHTYIVKLGYNAQWVHWIAHAPLFAEANGNNYTPMAENLKNLIKNGARDDLTHLQDVTHLQIAWNCRLGKLSTYHPNAGFLWALFHQVQPVEYQFKYVISYVSSSKNTISGNEFHNFVWKSNSDLQLQVQICYKKAIEAKLPTAQEEYDRIKDQINLIRANGISSEALKFAALPINQY